MKILILGTLVLFGIVIFSIAGASILTQDFSLLKLMNLNHYLILLIVSIFGGLALEESN